MAVIAQTNWNGGVNEEDFLADLAEDEVRRAYNAIITRDGSLSKRSGTSQLGSDANTQPIFGLKGFRDQANLYWRLKMRSTTLVEYNSGPWDTVVQSGLTAGLYLRMNDFFGPDDGATTTGTASSGTDYTLVDTGIGWTVDQYRDFVVIITGGTGAGQVKTILANTADTLTIDGRWITVPDGTSTYGIYARVRVLYCSNGTDASFKVVSNGGGGLATATTPSIPTFTDALVVNNRLWGISGTRVYYSDLGNGEAIGSLNFIDTGETLRALGQVNDSVAIYSATKTGVVIGNSPDNFQFFWRDRAHGCVATQSVAHWNNYSFALAQDGIYAFDGVSTRLVSRKISPSIQAMSQTLKSSASGFVYENRYYFMHAENSTSTVKDRIWVMDLIWSSLTGEKGGVWTSFEGLRPNVMATLEDSNGFLNLYIGKSNSSRVVQLFDGSYSDEGSSIQFRVDSREFDMGAIGRMKKLAWFFYEGNVQSVSSTLQLSKNIDGYGFEIFGSVQHTQTGGVWDVALFDVSLWGGLERIIQRFRPGSRGRTIQFQFYNNVNSEPVEMFKFECQTIVHTIH